MLLHRVRQAHLECLRHLCHMFRCALRRGCASIPLFILAVLLMNYMYQTTEKLSENHPHRQALPSPPSPKGKTTLQHDVYHQFNTPAFRSNASNPASPNIHTKRDDDHLRAQFKRRTVVIETECSKLFMGDKEEITKASKLLDSSNGNLEPSFYISKTQNCSAFIEDRGYIMDSLTKEERDFPIAFSLLMYQSVEQAERLLRSIYRPQNLYCVHVDGKSSPLIHQAMASISRCFPNVMIASKTVEVTWGQYSVLEPEIICMKDLWETNKKWKYFINLTGQEFPLKTNYELVKILTAYNGANDVESTIKRADSTRWTRAGRPPHNITLVKGSIHVVVNRNFVDYVLHNQTAIDFLEWSKNTYIPDETFFASLNGNPQLGIRGSYKGIQESTSSMTKPFLARLKNWGDWNYQWPCYGKRVRGICVFGVGDLPFLGSNRHIFANKFHMDFQPLTLSCMEELIFNRTRDEFYEIISFNATFYSNLGFVKDMVR